MVADGLEGVHDMLQKEVLSGAKRTRTAWGDQGLGTRLGYEGIMI